MPDLKKFAKGQTCSESGCRAKRWYLENGMRFCKNGHQIEGFVQFDIDEEDNFGLGGKISRKKKEKAEKVKKHVAGVEARELFVACAQLILRQQVEWLDRRFAQLPASSPAPSPSSSPPLSGLTRAQTPWPSSPGLERIVRQLWDWRLRQVPDLKSVNAAKGKENDFGESQESQDSDGTGGLTMFSSQSETALSTDDASEASEIKAFRRRKSWWKKETWPVPSLVETLTLCYLGCLFAKLPVRVGDIRWWAKTSQLPYLRALDRIPEHGRERMPLWVVQALNPRPWHLDNIRLRQTLTSLVTFYKHNFDLEIPALDHQLLLPLYIRDLALPTTLPEHVAMISKMLNLEFSYPTKRPRAPKEDSPSPDHHTETKRWQLLDDPEVLLVSCVVAATKYAFPLDETERFPRDESDPLCVKMDWGVWHKAFSSKSRKSSQVFDFARVGSSQVRNMSEQEMDDYLDWYQETKTGEEKDETEIDQLFPLTQPESRPVLRTQDLTEAEWEQRNRVVREAMTEVEPRSDPEDSEPLARIGDSHQLIPRVEELAGHARAFYEEVAEIAGLQLKDLVRAVYGLEVLIASHR